MSLAVGAGHAREHNNIARKNCSYRDRDFVGAGLAREIKRIARMACSYRRPGERMFLILHCQAE